jgi:uncharacterized membrane protein
MSRLASYADTPLWRAAILATCEVGMVLPFLLASAARSVLTEPIFALSDLVPTLIVVCAAATGVGGSFLLLLNLSTTLVPRWTQKAQVLALLGCYMYAIAPILTFPGGYPLPDTSVKNLGLSISTIFFLVGMGVLLFGKQGSPGQRTTTSQENNGLN